MKKIILLSILVILCSPCVFAVVNKPSKPSYYNKTKSTVQTSNPSDKFKKVTAQTQTNTNANANTADLDKFETLDPTYVDPNAPIEQQLHAMAMGVLKAAENRNNTEINKIIQQMVQKGVTEVTSPEVVAKKTPTCPPIRMELEKGRIISGSKCSRFSYTYNDKDYWVGYCK